MSTDSDGYKFWVLEQQALFPDLLEKVRRRRRMIATLEAASQQNLLTVVKESVEAGVVEADALPQT